MGVIGKGILGTIQEGVGGTSSRQLYYGTGVAFYQAPSMQRSYGDDLRSFNVKQFGARGMVNLPRRWFEMGPTEIFFTYPINYAWAGPEYHVKYQPKNIGPRTLNPITPADYIAGAVAATTQDTATAAMAHWLGELGTEVRNGPNILPTYFWSGGVGFAFPAMIELNMGGGGNIIFDRYTNFAMIMASVPTISMRKDLMVMAGGGLYYDHETDYQELPVKFGWVPTLTDEGTSYNRNTANSQSTDVGENEGLVWAPIEWNISVPIKTPQTNYWNCLVSRKPIDTSCFASDLQYIIALGNFYEFSDTGTGLAHCPYYYPPLNVATNPLAIAADCQAAVPFYHPVQGATSKAGVSVFAGAAGAWVYTKNLQDGWFVRTAPSGTPVGVTPGTGVWLYNAAPAASTITTAWPVPSLLPPGYFYTGGSPQMDFNWEAVFAAGGTVTPPIFSNTNGYYSAIASSAAALVATPTVLKVAPRNRIATNPRIWTNHYRVCNGFVYGGYGQHRPKFAVPGTAAQTDNRYMKDVFSVANGSSATSIQYPPGFTRMEFRNRSLKLTNPALSARLPLQSAPQSCVYYPFAYGFSQTYRIPAAQNPWDVAGFHRWNSQQVLGSSYLVSTGQTPTGVFQDTLQVSNKITQNIIMPANPVTSMIVGIYREKDRKYLGMNTQGSYSPALFWNALNPVRSTLYDGGNIMFDYQSRKSQDFGSLVDRPDCLRIPFRGGLCQLDPQNILSSPFEDVCVNSLSGDFPNGLRKSSSRNGRNSFGNGASHGSRNQPIHCTEWYNCHLIEYPFCMQEPLGREGTVQSTPSFAKTILRMEFYIDALLKPQRGLDDMYDQTTKVPPYWYSGEWNYLSLANGLPYNSSAGTQATAISMPYGTISFDGGGTVATTARQVTSNVANTVPNAYILAPPSEFDMYSDDREGTVQSVRGTVITNPNFTMGNASSWNVNDGALVIVISFIQNQVWTISPLRTSILSARG
jgi:hypothetical protein